MRLISRRSPYASVDSRYPNAQANARGERCKTLGLGL